MATKKEDINYAEMNVYRKLQIAREMFLTHSIKKSGKNMQLEFTYFELADIVPVAEPIFTEVGLCPIITILNDVAMLEMKNIDNDHESVTFTLPFTPVEANRATNVMMALGSSVTYIRRYLYMVALDIVEADTIDASAGIDDKATKAPPVGTKATSAPKTTKKTEKATAPTPTTKKTTPPTAANRTEIKQQVTGGNTLDELKQQTLKQRMKDLLSLDASQDEFVQKLAVATKGFKKATDDEYNAIIGKVETMIKELEGSAE